MTPEQKARLRIDELLAQAGWQVCNLADADIHADPGQVKGVAIREFPLNAGYGYADYLLYVNGKACGVIEAKKEGATLTGVELQSARYAQGLPTSLPAWQRPLPFRFESPAAVVLPSFLAIAASTGQARDLIESMIRITTGQCAQALSQATLNKAFSVNR
jgi:type I site-specific restriction endonuclease